MERGPKTPESCDLKTAVLLIAVALIFLLNQIDISASDLTQLKFLIGGVALLQHLPVEQLYKETKKYLVTVFSSQESPLFRENTQTGDD